MTFSELESSSFQQAIPRGILRWYAILRTPGVSAGDLKRDTKNAKRLRSRFWSNPNADQVDSFEWVSRWPGTLGGGRALRISWPVRHSFQPPTFADLLDKQVVGDWEDLHAIDLDGLVFYTVTHERMVVRRVTGAPKPDDEQMVRGESADPDFVTRMQKAP